MNNEIWKLYNEISDSFNDLNITDIEIDTNVDNSENLNKKKCINCNETEFLTIDGEMIICSLCGAENDTIIDYHAEWRFYGAEDKRSSDPNRCGMPSNSLVPDLSLSTIILGKGFEVYRKLNSWNGLSYKHRSLIAILNKIAIKANIDNVPQSIIDSTMNMYKMISNNYIKRGDSRESLIAACFFNALRDKGLIRSTAEVAKLFNIQPKKLSKGCNEFTELMYSKNKDYIKTIKPIESKDLIERFCNILNINEFYIKMGISSAIIIDKLGICQENNPKSIAVGIIYLISLTYNLDVSKKNIAFECKTSEVTVSNTYNQMIRFKKYILPKDNSIITLT